MTIMVGTILEVMTEEHDREESEKAHHERHQMATQLATLEAQLDEIKSLLKSRGSPQVFL